MGKWRSCNSAHIIKIWDFNSEIKLVKNSIFHFFLKNLHYIIKLKKLNFMKIRNISFIYRNLKIEFSSKNWKKSNFLVKIEKKLNFLVKIEKNQIFF